MNIIIDDTKYIITLISIISMLLNYTINTPFWVGLIAIILFYVIYFLKYYYYHDFYVYRMRNFYKNIMNINNDIILIPQDKTINTDNIYNDENINNNETIIDAAVDDKNINNENNHIIIPDNDESNYDDIEVMTEKSQNFDIISELSMTSE